MQINSDHPQEQIKSIMATSMFVHPGMCVCVCVFSFDLGWRYKAISSLALEHGFNWDLRGGGCV